MIGQPETKPKIYCLHCDSEVLELDEGWWYCEICGAYLDENDIYVDY